MRLATFNIHHGTVGKHGPVDPDRLAEVCAGFDADVLALQEVDRGTFRVDGADLAEIVARRCGMAHVFGASRRFPGGHYGNAVLVRGAIDHWSLAPLPRIPGWRFWQERRTVLRVAARVDEVALTVVATHLAVPQRVNGPQLDHLLAGVEPSAGPVVVLGDLNRFPSTAEPAARRAGLTYVPHGPTNPVPRRRLVIDHVLCSPGIAVRSVRVEPTAMSDHAALLVDVDLQEVDHAT